MIDLKLKSCCTDCPHAYITAAPEIFYQQGKTVPLIGTTTIFCKHMDVCTHFIDAKNEGFMMLCMAEEKEELAAFRNASVSSQEAL